MRGDDNGDTREEDSSSEFSDLEPPPEFEKVLEDSGITHNASEPKESPGNGEAKDDFDDNENGESSRDQPSIEVEDDVEEGKIQKSKESSEIGEKGKRKPAKPSPLVHVGSTRDQETELNGSAESDETSSLSKRKLLITGFCACLFFIVIVQAITIGLFVSQNNSSDKDTSFENDEERSPTLRPTTLVPSTTPTEGNVFESIANDGNSIRLNQVSFCDECTERVTVPDNYHLPWNDRTYVTEFEVNSNGRVNLHCWNFSNCATIDVVVMNLSPNVQGSIYILWEQENVQDEDRLSTKKQQQRRRNSLTVSFEDVMLFGFFDESPYRVNAQVKISEGEITICYGAGKIQNNWMRAGVYNYTGNYQDFRPATGLPFDKNGYGSTFPAETCQTFSDGGGYVQTANPTYGRYPHTPQPTITPTNYYRTPSPTDWFSRTSPPTIIPIYYQTPIPTNWYPRTSPPTITPTYYQTPSPTKWFPRTAPPTITTDWFSRTSVPTISPTIGPMNYQTPSPTKWFPRTAQPTITTDWFSRTSLPTIPPTSYQETPSPTNWYPRTSPPTIGPTNYQLVLLGNLRQPASAYPLRRCAGDCDNDGDCAAGLFCFERNGGENVPGCIGGGQPGFDYCYNPGSGFERLIVYPQQEFDYYELFQCQGDCDFDSDCAIGFFCFEREGGGSGSVPTCVGNANVIGFGNDDFCIPRPRSDTLISVYKNKVGGDVAGGGVYPIPRCAGDCDTDGDCQGSLTCFQRAGFTAVPGCTGTGEEDYDYCI